MEITSCAKCELHKHYTCLYEETKPEIEVIASNTPQKTNRNIFTDMGKNVRDETLNYYVITKVLGEVKNIQGYANYTAAKKRFLRGDFQTEEVEKEETIPLSKIDKKLLLLPTLDNTKHDMEFNGAFYVIDTGDTSFSYDTWKIVYYLYNTYTNEGLGDVKINGVAYKCLFNPIKDYPSDLIVVYSKEEDKLLIGSIKKSV